MSEQLLQVRNLSVSVEDKPILHGIDLEVRPGETHVLMGPNGAGKSTLGYTIMGSPRYEVTDGEILFKGKELLEETADQRAKDGIFLSFQNPLEVSGVSLRNFIRNAVEQRSGSRIKLWTFKKELEKAMEVLQMDPSYGDRDLNVGFSGGEKKKAEILQLLMLKPSLAILDETDSGLDVDAVRTVSKGVEECSADHHPQHQNLRVSACGQDPCSGKRQDRGIRRCFSRRRDQRAWFRAFSGSIRRLTI